MLPRLFLPRVVASDRGPGFYVSGIRNGEIVAAYNLALRAEGFRPFAGENAAGQPADCPDVLLHETAAGWIRNYFKKHPFRRAAGVDRNVERVKSLMAKCVDHNNREHDVHDLCSAWPRRLEGLVGCGGQRLKD